jgi:virulence factor Mce-like protein
MRRRATASILANPVLVGAVTVLVVIVAVFLAYNANNGLPFVPTRDLKIELPNGAELVKGNEVREGGFRVGIVSAMRPAMLEDGQVGAIATLKLDKSAGALPKDTTVIVRPRSALGLKYVDLTKGTSSQTLADGATLPLAQASTETNLDDVYNIFDSKTRSASDVNLQAFGDAFSGRGADLSSTIRELPTTLRVLTPVATNLANPSTQLDNFFKQLETTAGTIAPVAGTFSRLNTTMANTWHAFSEDPKALQDTISKGPPTEDVGTKSFAVQVPFLRLTAAWSRDLNGATAELRGALPTLNSALRIAVPVTQRTVTTNTYPKLQDAMTALRDLAQAPTTNAALRGLTATDTTLNPQLRYLGPYVTVCNDFNSFFTFLGEHFSEPDPSGTSQRALLNFVPNSPNGLNSAGATHPVNGNAQANSEPPGTQPPGVPQAAPFFHGAANGQAITPTGAANCAAGQRGYIHGGKLADQFGDPNANIEVDAHWPLGYAYGPTFAHFDGVNGGSGLNASHTPPGETFTQEPGGIGAVTP